MKKNFLTVRAVWHWNIQPCAIVGSPSLEVLKQRLCVRDVVVTCAEQRDGLDDLYSHSQL